VAPEYTFGILLSIVACFAAFVAFAAFKAGTGISHFRQAYKSALFKTAKLLSTENPISFVKT
jgi:hypothetical protein